MIKRIFIVLLLTFVILGGIFGFKFYQIQQAISQIKPPPPAVVAAATVKLEQWPSSLTAVGSFTPVAGVYVSNEVVGKIKVLHFHSGQTVKSGQLLVELDTDTDQAELAGLQAELQLAKARLQRSEKMIQKKYVSQADYDEHKAQLEQAAAAVHAKRTRIDKKMIRAPFAGELGIREVNLGQFLSEGTDIVSLQQLDPIHLDFSLPERHISQLAKNQVIIATIQSYPDQIFTGKIIALNPSVEQDTRSLKVRAILNNADKRLRPGMFAQVKIESGNALSVLTLPDTAISYNPYGNSVFLIEKNDNGLTVQSRQVVTGQSREGRVEIVSGLQVGDRVVSAGQVKLRNGIPVTLDAQPAPGEREAGQ
ncbi:MAG: efflux RND transporter periplasmic adaptor subunit [Methylomonas sp.]|jgi:membrane fusion protein (multidrug efflux system)|uniref:efflux RND transporter periplasmic adaptor subunit n=1 Tax=Methylomonas sp. TaxID=418 RepID=UPI0025DDC9E9|nr:efflux RND transporter periplasmic adaptor subunit [Methylomonas sp.]MCK9605015.1 efflux RND transporter periplasmic adaptor subunit [Methylomonas sp.]